VGLPQGDLFQIHHARQRGFKRKAVSSIHALINFFQHQAASLECSSLWIEWSQARSDQVGVDKTQRLGFSRQKVTGKSGFASAVGSCNYDDFFQQEPLAILRFEKQFYVRRSHLLKPVSTIRLELKNKDFFGSKRVSPRKKPLQLLARAFEHIDR
jgi:hypothetical protein